MITASAVGGIDLDFGGLTDAASSLTRSAVNLVLEASEAERAWASFPEAFWMPGASESIYGVVAPASQAARDFESATQSLAASIDEAGFSVHRLKTRRSALIDKIVSLHATAQLTINAYALQQTSIGAVPFGGVHWQDVPSLRNADADLRAEAASIEAAWATIQEDLSSRINAIEGGERAELRLPSISGAIAVTASAVVPAFPGGAGTLSGLGPEIGTFFEGLWAAMTGAGMTSGVGAAASFATVLGELGLVLSLSGDTDQSRRGATEAEQAAAATRRSRALQAARLQASLEGKKSNPWFHEDENPFALGESHNPDSSFVGNAGEYSDEELAQLANGHAGDGIDDQGRPRPSTEQILEAIRRGKRQIIRDPSILDPSGRDPAVEITHGKIKVTINIKRPFRSTAVFPEDG